MRVEEDPESRGRDINSSGEETPNQQEIFPIEPGLSKVYKLPRFAAKGTRSVIPSSDEVVTQFQEILDSIRRQGGIPQFTFTQEVSVHNVGSHPYQMRSFIIVDKPESEDKF